MFQLRVLNKDERVSLEVRGGRKIILDIPNKIHRWKNRYVFVEVPEDFQLPKTWRDVEQLSDKSPTLSKKEVAQWKKLENFHRDLTYYSDLESVTSLLEEGLRVRVYTYTVLDFNSAI